MAKLTLNNIDEGLLRSIELRAETMGRSVEDVAREALERGLRTDARAGRGGRENPRHDTRPDR